MTARSSRPHPPHLAIRHPHRALARRRGHRVRWLALLAVVGPGLLAGLSDDDPAGITTYSILGADYGYELLWVLALSTAALVVFHELAARTGVVTGKGLMRLSTRRQAFVRVSLKDCWSKRPGYIQGLTASPGKTPQNCPRRR